MTTYTLLLLALPLLIVPFVVPIEEPAASVGQLIIAGLGLAALWHAFDTLDPALLRVMSVQSQEDGWFLTVTVGALLTGACLLPHIMQWRRLVLALPFAVGLLIAAPLHVLPLLIGLAVGAIPSLGTLIRARPRMQIAGDIPPLAPWQIATALVAGVAAIAGPLLVSLVALALLAWTALRRVTIGGVPLIAAVAVIAIGAWTWLALTIAGMPLIGFARFATDAPVSGAAALLLAAIALVWIVAVAAVGVSRADAHAAIVLPALAIVVVAWAPSTADGLAHWQPLVTTVVAVAAIMAAGSGRWTAVAAALVILAGTRAGAVGISGAIVAGCLPAAGRLVSARVRAALMGLATALTAAAVLTDEVLVAVTLAFGIAIAANLQRGVVARGSVAGHL